MKQHFLFLNVTVIPAYVQTAPREGGVGVLTEGVVNASSLSVMLFEIRNG